MPEGAPKENDLNSNTGKEDIPLQNYIIPSQEQMDKAKEVFDTYILAPLSPEQEKEQQDYFEGKGKRERKAGKGMWGASGAALGLVAVGIPLATGQILKYSLLGWKIGPNGMPQVDKESLADFDTAYRWASGTKKG